jgi:hypothetical protein
MHCFDVVEQARFPVIAAVQGGCIGGALDLAAACDLRVCSADAFFTVQEIHIGMAADLGVLQRLPKIVPPAVAREMAYTGDRVGAERALAIGLVNAVLPDAQPPWTTRWRWPAASPPSRRWPWPAASWRINYAIDHPTADALQQMTLLQSAIFDIDEMAGWYQRSRSRSSLSPSGGPVGRPVYGSNVTGFANRCCPFLRRREVPSSDLGGVGLKRPVRRSAHWPGTSSDLEVVVDGQRRVAAESLLQVGALAPGLGRRAGHGQLVFDATEPAKRPPPPEEFRGPAKSEVDP